MNLIKTSKFLSLVLRHDPGRIGLVLDPEGWAEVDDLLSKLDKAGKSLTREQLGELVATNSKQRFRLSDDGDRIRASQGHSIDVELGIEPSEPPSVLYHGTATRFLDGIEREGLISGSRQHVHLSADTETATMVGRRHGKPVILEVRASEMHQAGMQFYLSENKVWLTNRVPREFLYIPRNG